MEIAFAGGAFAEIACYDAWWDIGVLEGLELQGVGRACSLWDLCC